SVVTGDMDGDGDLDLLTTNQDGNQVAWYRNDGGESFGSARVIDSYPLMLAKRAEFVDMDSDGDMDVVAGSFGEPPVPSGEVAWYENDGSESFTKHVIINDAGFEGVYSVATADFDKDGDQDVVAVSQLDNKVALFVNNGSEVFTTRIVDAAAIAARTVRVADVDADGWDDLLVASVDDDTVAWHRNNQAGGFVKAVVDNGADGAYGVYAADMDQDGDLDVLSAGRDSGEVKVYYQLGDPRPPGADEVVLVEPGGLWHIRRPGLADYTFYFGVPGDVPLFGDWDGDGVDTPGAWRPGAGGGLAYMTNTLPPDGGVGVGDFSFYFGNPGDQVFSGDWDGDGADSLGVNRGGRLFLTNANGSGGGPVATDYDFYFGVPGDRAFGGDGDGDGDDGVFVYRESTGLVYYTNSAPASGVASTAADFFFGIASDRFVAGDWDADGIDTAAIFRESTTTVYWSNTNPSGGAAAPTDGSYVCGSPGWIPVAGITGLP
ncbi:MAG: VCBS repeat-containing protein, partial [Acidimicrobiia bacterium]|nr:VCBS repeat-containing protein [Acidimicrobiia bacterium]